MRKADSGGPAAFVFWLTTSIQTASWNSTPDRIAPPIPRAM